MPSKTTYPLAPYGKGPYIKFAPANIDAHFIDIANLVDGVQKKLFKWVVPEEGGGGGLFYKRSAENFAAYAKEQLLTGKGTEALEPLSSVTIRMKREAGFPYPERIGVATGQMANAIRAVKANKGWKVGISQHQLMHVITGSFTKPYQAMYMLEHGRKAGISASGRKIPYQPPRPWFAQAFMRWIREKAPVLLSKTFLKEFGYGLVRKMEGVEPPGMAWSKIREKELAGLETGAGMHKRLIFQRRREVAGRYIKGFKYDFLTKTGKMVKLYADINVNIFDEEEGAWITWAKAQKKWGLISYR